MGTALAMGAAMATVAIGLRRRWLVGRTTALATQIRAAAAAAASKRRQALARQRAAELARFDALRAEYDRGVALLTQQRAARFQQSARLREQDLLRRQSRLAERSASLGELNGRVAKLQRQVGAAAPRRLEALATVAGHTVQEAQRDGVAESLQRAQLAGEMARRRTEQAADEHARRRANRLLTLAMDRMSTVGHLERSQNTFPIGDNAALAALADPAGPAYAIVEAHGCELWRGDDDALDDDALTVRSDDPLAREVGRRLLRRLGRAPHTQGEALQRLLEQIRGELDREVRRAGAAAVRSLGLDNVHPDIVNLVGRLKFRLSYSQNQLKHALEVAHLCGILAAEMGLDVALARRGGLLHDIGKAITHEREGAHAVLGAHVARQCGEVEEVANAIGAHHHDEAPLGPLAYVVAAADAISGARPGARREAVAQYLGRIEAILRIAHASPAVERVDIMQAGREVRVIVAGTVSGSTAGETRDSTSAGSAPRPGQAVPLGDAALYPLAQSIARALEEQIVFPGQIRVTVIRESRAVGVAR